MHRITMLAALVGPVAACRDEAPVRSGFDEPVRVVDGFLREGDLPIANGGPEVTAIEVTNAIALMGQRGRGLGGRVDDDTWAVGVRFASLGSGWWIHEVGDVAALFPGERDFALAYDVGKGIPPGLHALRVAAIDGEGRRGPPVDLDLCVLEDAVPAGLNPCDPTLPPPAVVIGLAWNRDVDLDLILETPDGKRVSWKAPSTAAPENGVVPDEDLEDPHVGRLNRDSNAGCHADGRNSEAVVWEEEPSAGTWGVYVDLFDACGEEDVTFTATVYRRRARGDGTFRLEETERRRGTLVADYDAYGGAEAPLFVMAVELP